MQQPIFHIIHPCKKFPVKHNDPVSLKNFLKNTQLTGKISEDFIALTPFFKNLTPMQAGDWGKDRVEKAK